MRKYRAQVIGDHSLIAVILSYPPVVYLLLFMCDCPQGAAAYPENEDQQQRLREAAEGLRVATNAAAQNAIKKKLINRLEVRGILEKNIANEVRII